MIVLLVEDEPIIAMLLESSVRRAGHSVAGPVETMAEGLAIASRERLDLAVVDMNLADGSSGAELARALLGRWAVRSLFATGRRDQAFANRDVSLGVIGKPYDAATIMGSIKVAEHIVCGRPGPLPPIPRGLKLFDA